MLFSLFISGHNYDSLQNHVSSTQETSFAYPDSHMEPEVVARIKELLAGCGEVQLIPSCSCVISKKSLDERLRRINESFDSEGE